jgi:endonuclease/exonuclease/phosphatase family metal-dependent hydrolase
MPLTALTWNLKGSKGLDFAPVVAHIRSSGADVAMLQEIQRRQAERLAHLLGAASCQWGFKHWPVRTQPEGMAVIGLTQPVPARTRALTRHWELWSSRRRIVQVGSVAVEPGERITLANVHLSSGDAEAVRLVEADAILRLIAEQGRPALLAGDLNDGPDSPVLARFAAAGLRDVWAVLRPDDPGPTNWRGWRPGTPRPPTRRLDYVLVTDGLEPVDVSVPRFGDPDFAPFASISDHLPVTATVARVTG